MSRRPASPTAPPTPAVRAPAVTAVVAAVAAVVGSLLLAPAALALPGVGGPVGLVAWTVGTAVAVVAAGLAARAVGVRDGAYVVVAAATVTAVVVPLLVLLAGTLGVPVRPATWGLGAVVVSTGLAAPVVLAVRREREHGLREVLATAAAAAVLGSLLAGLASSTARTMEERVVLADALDASGLPLVLPEVEGFSPVDVAVAGDGAGARVTVEYEADERDDDDPSHDTETLTLVVGPVQGSLCDLVEECADVEVAGGTGVRSADDTFVEVAAAVDGAHAVLRTDRGQRPYGVNPSAEQLLEALLNAEPRDGRSLARVV